MIGLTTSYYLNSPLENRKKTQNENNSYMKMFIATCVWHKLNHVVLRALWNIDVHLISTLV